MDTTKSILGSAKRFLSGTILSRISGMLRDMAMAFAFGTQETVAAFLVAYRLANLLRRLFGEGAMQSAFIPQFESLRKTTNVRACRFFCDLAGLVAVGLTVIIGIVMMVLGGFLLFTDMSESNREVIYFTMLLMPSLLFICLFGLSASLLQCEKTYFIPGVSPVAFNLMWIVGVVWLQYLSATEAIPKLCFWVIAASCCQWLMTLPSVWRVLRQYNLKQPFRNCRIFSVDVRGLAKPLLLGIVGVAATQINNACDAIFARYADLEGPAMLWYALRIQQLPLALFGIAIAGALLPPLSRAIKAGDLVAYQHFLVFAIRRCIALMLPLTAILLVMGDSCVNLIFGRGDFTDGSVVGTTICLWAYGIGLLPMTLVLLLAPAFYAKSDQWTPAKASLVAVLANVGLNSILIAGFGLGAGSVAVATSLSAVMNVFLLVRMLPESSVIFSKKILMITRRVLLCTSMASAAVILFDVWFLRGSYPLFILQGIRPQYSHEFSDQLIRLGLQGSCFLTVMAISAWLLKANDLIYLFSDKLPVQASISSTK